MKKEDQKLNEIQSDEVKEILSATPTWINRWGISLIFILILMLLAVSWFIKYPDIVTGEVVLTTNIPPSHLVANTEGYIEELYQPNGAYVDVGTEVALIRNPVNKAGLDALELTIGKFDFQDLEHAINDLESLKELGDIQIPLNELIIKLIEYQNLNEKPFYRKSIGNINSLIEYNKRLLWITKQQLELITIEVSNATVKFKDDSNLFALGVISKHDYFEKQSQFFLKKQDLSNVKKSYVQLQISVTNFEKEKNEIEKEHEYKESALKASIYADLKKINGLVRNWEEEFLFVSPIAGRLTYLSNISKNDFVEDDRELFAVVPEDEHIIGVLKIENQSFGKVYKGQKVRMKFSNYPHQEFGHILGTVKEISKIPSETGYFIIIQLTNGMQSSYNIKIPYQPEMLGQGEVITEDLRLLNRVFYNFRKIFDK